MRYLPREGIIPACAGSTHDVFFLRWCGGDHPRLRGEHAKSRASLTGPKGSSPPARGARKARIAGTNDTRIIPACAGSTLHQRAQRPSSGDHPRLRGEHSAEIGPSRRHGGSSPPARGARSGAYDNSPARGIIPACAGSTRCRALTCAASRDHPRLRGEHAVTVVEGDMLIGSSPPARGALVGGVPVTSDDRIIPACAGSTRREPGSCGQRPDHPRLRGEHAAPPATPPTGPGSSPPARGARSGRARLPGCRRIIPACAGSTRALNLLAPRPRDHPRLRGEHVSGSSELTRSPGSSPPARGALLGGVLSHYSSRIIPACAGSTENGQARLPARQDHPRLRGEHFADCEIAAAWLGSSPPARGARPDVAGSPALSRIIPACAGSTII